MSLHVFYLIVKRINVSHFLNIKQSLVIIYIFFRNSLQRSGVKQLFNIEKFIKVNDFVIKLIDCKVFWHVVIHQ